MTTDSKENNWHSGYRVPQNFIPGLNHLPDSHHNKHKTPPSTRRGSSYSQVIAPISNYIKRKKNNEPGQRKDGVTHPNSLAEKKSGNQWLIDNASGAGRSDDDKKNVEDEFSKGGIVFSAKSNRSGKNMEGGPENKLCNSDKMDIENRKISEHSLTASLPDLTSNRQNQQPNSKNLNRKKSHSLDISPLLGEELALQVQDKLRCKLPKTMYMTAKIGMQNPICATGNIRRITAHHRESVVDAPRITSYKKNHSLGTLDLRGFCASIDSSSRRGSLFSKLLFPDKSSSSSPPLSPDCSIGNASPALFRRAKSYSGRIRLCSIDSGHSNYDYCSSIDLTRDHL